MIHLLAEANANATPMAEIGWPAAILFSVVAICIAWVAVTLFKNM